MFGKISYLLMKNKEELNWDLHIFIFNILFLKNIMALLTMT